jgi:hypothetical protein
MPLPPFSAQPAAELSERVTPDAVVDLPVGANVSALVAGLLELQAETRGHPEVRIAFLDGPVATDHRQLCSARLSLVDPLGLSRQAGHAREHGTRVAGIVLAQPDASDPGGIAPGCSGISIPIFGSTDRGMAACSDAELVLAIETAIARGAHILNISAGRRQTEEPGDPALLDVLARCEQRGLLVVCAAGNEGCACPQLPAAFPSCIAVGAQEPSGEPSEFSSWGGAYAHNGLVAPGANLRSLSTRATWTVCHGTSYATPIVTGVAALLMSLQHERTGRIDAHAVRAALLEGADPCPYPGASRCERFLKGALNVRRSTLLIRRGSMTMNETPSETISAGSEAAGPEKREVQAADCGCSGKLTSAPTLVFALGTVHYDFGGEARFDSFVQAMGDANPRSTTDMLAYLDVHPEAASRLIWTLNVDQTPLYAIVPGGPYAHVAYERLREVLGRHSRGVSERVAIAGVALGTATLQSGARLAAVLPEPSAIWDWSTEHLLAAVSGNAEGGAKREALQNFLQRVYFEVRNLGVTPEDRAVNFAATNAFQAQRVFASAAQSSLELDAFSVQRSPICRPTSLCYDVNLTFFNPLDRLGQARRVYRLTVDVSDVVPVTVGELRQWSVY